MDTPRFCPAPRARAQPIARGIALPLDARDKYITPCSMDLELDSRRMQRLLRRCMSGLRETAPVILGSLCVECHSRHGGRLLDLWRADNGPVICFDEDRAARRSAGLSRVQWPAGARPSSSDGTVNPSPRRHAHHRATCRRLSQCIELSRRSPAAGHGHLSTHSPPPTRRSTRDRDLDDLAGQHGVGDKCSKDLQYAQV